MFEEPDRGSELEQATVMERSRARISGVCPLSVGGGVGVLWVDLLKRVFSAQNDEEFY